MAKKPLYGYTQKLAMTKKILLILLLCTGCRADTPDKLLDAIEQVESGGRADAKGDYNKSTGEYKAIGSFQLWKIFVDDVNRTAKTKYTYQDRSDRKKSREMARKYIDYYGKIYENKTGQKATIDILAAMFCSGPNGYKKTDNPSVKKYIEKIKKALAKQTKE